MGAWSLHAALKALPQDLWAHPRLVPLLGSPPPTTHGETEAQKLEATFPSSHSQAVWLPTKATMGPQAMLPQPPHGRGRPSLALRDR